MMKWNRGLWLAVGRESSATCRECRVKLAERSRAPQA